MYFPWMSPHWSGGLLARTPLRPPNYRHLMFKALEAQRQMGNQDNPLVDTPPHLNIRELTYNAKDRATWRELDLVG